jgi:hypothetical protein
MIYSRNFLFLKICLFDFCFYRDVQQIEELLNHLTESIDETVKRQKIDSESSSSLSC